MLFYTPEFVVFSLVLLIALAVVQGASGRKLVLLLASYVFYMWWNPAFIALIIASTVIDYVVGRAIYREQRPTRRRALLVISLAANLGLLGWFKYAGFFQHNLLALASLFGFTPSWSALNITLPVGISFYTFQTMSYTIDVYRRQLEPASSPLDFALFVAFFPQLVAGPIVRAADFLPQLHQPVRVAFSPEAVTLIVRGLAKKVLVADNVAPLVDAVYSQPGSWPSLVVWIATVAFAVQIYCDFSGYSDMAIGLARILGYELTLNFDRPYFSRNPSEFWRRWHISLSSWLRDYLYIPLGGNRGGTIHTYRNLMLTMLLGGLWHGASWTFVLWGLMHGLALVLHRAYVQAGGSRITALVPPPLRHILAWGLMQYIVLLTWIPFRATDTSSMITVLKKFVFFDFNFHLAGSGAGALALMSTFAVLVGFAVAHTYGFFRGGLELKLARLPSTHAALWAAGIGTCFFWLWPLGRAPFIYFQF